MNLTKAQLKEVEQMSALFFPPADIAINLGLAADETESFINSIELGMAGHPVYCAFQRGRLATEIELRESVKQSALNGSNPAQQLMVDFLRGM